MIVHNSSSSENSDLEKKKLEAFNGIWNDQKRHFWGIFQMAVTFFLWNMYYSHLNIWKVLISAVSKSIRTLKSLMTKWFWLFMKQPTFKRPGHVSSLFLSPIFEKSEFRKLLISQRERAWPMSLVALWNDSRSVVWMIYNLSSCRVRHLEKNTVEVENLKKNDFSVFKCEFWEFLGTNTVKPKKYFEV